MARMRAIKPGFFTNDALAEIEPLGRLLFAGLWTIADRSGRLEDRPRKIKAELLPYDACNAETLLDDLAARGFIYRYAVNGTRLIQVINWERHQQPHVNERESDYPAPVQAPEPHPTSTVQVPECSDTNPSEQNSNRTELEPELEDEDAAPSAPAAAALPESVERLHALLFGHKGYDPSPAFLQKVGTKYGELDLETEGIKLLDWLGSAQNRKSQVCSTRFVLNWLQKATEAPPSAPARASPQSIRPNRNQDSRNPRDYFAAARR